MSRQAWRTRCPPLTRRTYANQRRAAHASVDCARVSCERLLPPQCSSHALYAPALLLVDGHGHLHTVVVSSLSTVPGANVFQTDGALAHPLAPPAIRPSYCGERRLFRPSPHYTWWNSYILLFIDRFRRRTYTYSASAAEFTAEGTADILVNKNIYLFGGVRLASPIMDYSSAPSCLLPCASSSACEKSRRAHTTPTATVTSSALTTPWLRCWQWSSTNDGTTRGPLATRGLCLQQLRQRRYRFGAERGAYQPLLPRSLHHRRTALCPRPP